MQIKKDISISVIVTAYQRPQALDLVLSSLANQKVQPNEIVIADDGSTKETKGVIDDWKRKSTTPIIHCWHKDQGFRAAEIRNKAVLKTTGSYLIFLDGDCLVFPDFIMQHKKLAEKEYMVMGSRLLCSESFTKEIELGKYNPLIWGLTNWLIASFKGQVNRIYPLVRLGNIAIRKLRPAKWKGIRTFNLAIWRKDFYAVNGFDERFKGWGHEDADLAIRLINSHIKRKDGQFAIPVLHLWHKESDRSHVKSNIDILHQSINQKKIAKNGMNKLMKID